MKNGDIKYKRWKIFFYQDSRVCKFCAYLFSWPQQNYNSTTEQILLRIPWSLAEQKSYNLGHRDEVTSRIVGEAETQNRSHTQMKYFKIRRDIMAAEEQGDPSPHPAPQPRVPMLEREGPQHLALKNSRDYEWVRQRVAEVPSIPLKAMQTYLLTESLSLSSSIGATAWTSPGTYWEELSCLDSGQVLEGQLFPRQKYC